jgi:putative spermidine/putrescine transport system substrate-binding protein
VSNGLAISAPNGASNGKVRAMVEAKHVLWDLCDSGVSGTGELGPRGLLEPIDYAIVDRSRILPEFGYEFGVVNYMFSTVLAWDTKVVTTLPTQADFFDLKKVPGKRMLRKDSQAMLEMALIADGVPIDKLYPIDLDRALRKISAIKSEILYWDTGAQSQTLLRSGEVAMGYLWHTRANLLKRRHQGPHRLEFRRRAAAARASCRWRRCCGPVSPSRRRVWKTTRCCSPARRSAACSPPPRASASASCCCRSPSWCRSR